MKAKYKVNVGQNGEDFAEKLLVDMGYTILRRNFRCSAGEIDIICRRGFDLHFVEVKTRVDNKRGSAVEAVTGEKLESMQRTAQMYIGLANAYDYNVSFDVLAIQVSYLENCG